MNELDLLKTHWQKEQNYIKFKTEDIIQMIRRSSTSIVKWLLMVCSFELLLGISLKTYYIVEDNYDIKLFNLMFEIIGTISTIIFLILFVREYLKIKTSNNTKTLMNSILKTRNYVRLYIILTLSIFFIQMIIDLSHFENFNKGLSDGFNDTSYNQDSKMEKTIFPDILLYTIFILTISTIGTIIYLYYRLIYIKLIRKLKNNYNELIRLEE